MSRTGPTGLPLQSQSETEQSFGIPSVFLRSAHAPAPRTLIDIVRASAEANPEAPAIDDGDTTLSYSELLDEIALGARWLGDAGVGAGDRVGIRMPSGSRSLYVAILSILAAGAAYVPVDADDPEERAELVFGEAQVAAIITGDGIQPGDGAEAARTSTGSRTRTRGRRLDHLHLRIHGHPQGRRGHSPQCRSLRRRRGAHVPPGRAHRAW